jgi:molybdate transport system substrate-binding protein
VAPLKVLSAGAAQAVVEKIAEDHRRATGIGIQGEFSAVGAIRQRLLAGAAADVVILTAALIDELVASGHVAAGSRADLGQVGTGIAVRAGARKPDVSSPDALRAVLAAAGTIVCPDPAVATAGKVVLGLIDQLGMTAALMPRLRYFPNGYAAMGWLAGDGGDSALGITQITEILANKGVTYAGPLPGSLQSKATYSAGLAARSAQADAAVKFIERLTSAAARQVLVTAGYEVS